MQLYNIQQNHSIDIPNLVDYQANRIHLLPNELILQIFCLIKETHIFNELRLTCRHWRSISDNLLENLLKKKFSDECLIEADKNKNKSEKYIRNVKTIKLLKKCWKSRCKSSTSPLQALVLKSFDYPSAVHFFLSKLNTLYILSGNQFRKLNSILKKNLTLSSKIKLSIFKSVPIDRTSIQKIIFLSSHCLVINQPLNQSDKTLLSVYHLDSLEVCYQVEICDWLTSTVNYNKNILLLGSKSGYVKAYQIDEIIDQKIKFIELFSLILSTNPINWLIRRPDHFNDFFAFTNTKCIYFNHAQSSFQSFELMYVETPIITRNHLWMIDHDTQCLQVLPLDSVSQNKIFNFIEFENFKTLFSLDEHLCLAVQDQTLILFNDSLQTIFRVAYNKNITCVTYKHGYLAFAIDKKEVYIDSIETIKIKNTLDSLEKYSFPQHGLINQLLFTEALILMVGTIEGKVWYIDPIASV